MPWGAFTRNQGGLPDAPGPAGGWLKELSMEEDPVCTARDEGVTTAYTQLDCYSIGTITQDRLLIFHLIGF